MAGFGTVSRDYGSPFIMNLDNSGGLSGTEILYQGEAEPGTANATAKWRIKKFTYDAGTNNIATVRWASGTDFFDKVWDNRATYTYA